MLHTLISSEKQCISGDTDQRTQLKKIFFYSVYHTVYLHESRLHILIGYM